VSTASGICHTVTAICRYRRRVGTGLSVLWVEYATHSTLKPVTRRSRSTQRSTFPSNFNPLNAELNPICHLLVLLGDLTFMGPCIVSIFQYTTKCNVTQFIYIWKLLNMFRVVLPPIIRSAYNCIYSIWYLSHRYCYLPLSWS
jgi:hypothetical protein